MKVKEGLSPDFEDMGIDILNMCSEFSDCACDGEYIDGAVVGYACWFHRNEDELNRIAKELIAYGALNPKF